MQSYTQVLGIYVNLEFEPNLFSPNWTFLKNLANLMNQSFHMFAYFYFLECFFFMKVKKTIKVHSYRLVV